MHRTKGINLYFIMLMGIMHSRSMCFQNVPFLILPKLYPSCETFNTMGDYKNCYNTAWLVDVNVLYGV